jgi:hypothetical protein
MDFSDLTKALPGGAGALVSTLFFRDPWPRRIALFVSGSMLSLFGTAWTTKVTGLDTGFAGFLLGLFGMAFISRVFEAWEALELTSIVRDALRAALRLPPKEQ